MKPDVRLIKNILNEIQEKESFYVSTTDLFQDLRAKYDHLEDEEFANLFYGHLFLLKDNNVIEETKGYNLGISYSLNGELVKAACFIRLTSLGYDYAKILNKNGMLEKFKNFTIKEGIILIQQMLLKYAENYINTHF